MIISHKNKYTISRVPKTGSTSLEASARMCGLGSDDTDICSPIEDAWIDSKNLDGEWYEESKKRIKRYKFVRDKVKNFPEIALSDQEKEILKDSFAWCSYNTHCSLSDMVNEPLFDGSNIITKKQIFNYKNYGFLRNPYQRIISSWIWDQTVNYNFHKKTPNFSKNSFHKFIKNDLRNKTFCVFRPQVDYFFVDGKQVLEPLIFENWSSEAQRMMKELGAHPISTFPRFKEKGLLKSHFRNSKNNKNLPNVEEYLYEHNDIMLIVNDFYKNDIDFYMEVIK
jgi:hypothetical protein